MVGFDSQLAAELGWSSKQPPHEPAQFVPDITRRRLIQLLMSSGAAVALGACSPEQSATTGTGPASSVTTIGAGFTDDLPFSLWEDVLAAVRTSQDHLSAIAARLVAAGNPEPIFEFVRDRILTVPPNPSGFRGSATDQRCGVRSVLRTGAGTPREKVEVLAALLGSAGFETRVLQGSPNSDLDATRAVIRTTRAEFIMDVDPARVQGWMEAIRLGSPPELGRLDPYGETATAVGDAVNTAWVPPETDGFDWTIDALPLLEVSAASGPIHANPFSPDLAWGDPGVAGNLTPALGLGTLPPVEVALMVARSSDPSKMTTLAHGSWPLDSLTGRRLMIRFVPVGEPENTLFLPAVTVPALAAVMVVDGPDLDIEVEPELAVIGDAVTVGGSILTVSDNGALKRDDLSLTVEPDAPSSVSGLVASVDASAHPLVRLEVSPLDTAGAAVEGLSGSSVAISENGRPVSFVLDANRPLPPRILVVLDTSGSIPEVFRNEGAGEFGRALVDAIGIGRPDARYQTAGIGSGSLTLSPTVVATGEEMAAAMRAITGFGSDVWSALAQARFADPTAVVLISDGRFTDAEPAVAEARNWIGSGPPVIAIAVGDAEPTALEDIADLTNGAVFSTSDVAGAVAAVTEALDEIDGRPLRLSYISTSAPGAKADIQLSVGSAIVALSYLAPTRPEALRPSGLSGIYLSIRFRGQEVVRTIAGVPFETATRLSPISQDLLDEVRAAMFGWTVLSIEGGAPTYAAWLDDALVTRRSWRPMLEAVEGGSPALAAVQSGAQGVPPELPVLHPPLPESDDAVTFETGPRMLLLSRLPRWDAVEFRRADILPFTRFYTLGPEPSQAAATTVERTSVLAAAEALLFERSTASILSKQTLRSIGPFEVPDPAHPFADVLLRYSGWTRLIPEAGSEFAFWAVDEHGTVIGVLPDGSGGGSSTSDVNEACKQVNQAAALVDLAGNGMGMPLAFGAFVALGKAIAKQALREAAIIASLGSTTPDTGGCGSPGDVPCDVAKGYVFDNVPYGKIISGADAATAAATGSDLINC